MENVMDLVYICRSGENEELRYSIRSAVKNFSHDNIWVVGNKPDWYVGNFVEVPDKKTKFDNIIACTHAITDVGAISDDFVLMNDDFFFLKPLGKMPIYHGGLLRDKIDRYISLDSRRYSTLLSRTYNNLVRQGIKNPLDYDIHVPMIMNKAKLRSSIKKAYFPRSGYGNIHDVGGELVNDVKTYGPKNPLRFLEGDIINNNHYFLSTEDTSFDKVYQSILKEMFPTPSKYELT
jgi:hypothetical protein